MENEKNKRAGIGQKPRGRQQTRGVEALPSEKPVASNEGQEEGVKDPVSETADRVQEGGGLLEEISTISDKTAENEKMTSVSVSEGGNLAAILAKSVEEDGLEYESQGELSEAEKAFFDERNAERDHPLLVTERESGKVRAATREEEVAFKDQTIGGYEIRLDPKRAVLQFYQAELGPQADGSFLIAVRLEEGYLEPVRQWAEAEGISPEEWCSRQLSHYLETWGQPAKSR